MDHAAARLILDALVAGSSASELGRLELVAARVSTSGQTADCALECSPMDSAPHTPNGQEASIMLELDRTIRVTTTVRYRGGLKIEAGAELAARKAPAIDGWGGWSVAHPTVEGAYAHVPASHARAL